MNDDRRSQVADADKKSDANGLITVQWKLLPKHDFRRAEISFYFDTDNYQQPRIVLLYNLESLHSIP